MVKIFIFTFIIIVSSFLTPTIGFASSKKACSQVLSLEAEVQKAIDSMFAKAHTGLTDRGFLGPVPEETSPAAEAYAQSLGFMKWGLRIYIVPSIEAAKEHFWTQQRRSSQQENLPPKYIMAKDPLMWGVYLIFPPPEGVSTRISKLYNRVSPKYLFNRLSPSGVYYLYRDYELTPNPQDKSPVSLTGDVQVMPLDPHLIQERITPESLVWVKAEEELGPFLYQGGWFMPQVRGVLSLEPLLESKTYKKLLREARTMARNGFRFRFNGDSRPMDFKLAVEKVRDQDRVGQIAGSSRYADEELFESMLQSYQDGHAFSVEVWTPQGELAAGAIGHVHGNLYSPDSIFYDQNLLGGQAINAAKIALIALLERTAQLGIPFIDAGMVSPFTASLKGRLISREDFLSGIRSLPRHVIRDYTDWEPLSEER